MEATNVQFLITFYYKIRLFHVYKSVNSPRRSCIVWVDSSTWLKEGLHAQPFDEPIGYINNSEQFI